MGHFYVIIGFVGLAIVAWLVKRFTAAQSIQPDRDQVAASDSLSALIDRLEALGFYRYVLPEKVAACKREDFTNAFPFTSDSGRVFQVDSEELAEGNVQEFLEEIRPFLAQQCVQIASIRERCEAGEDHTVTVNGITTMVCTAEELEEDTWEPTTRRTFMLVNCMLADTGSDERVYLLYGGNEGQAIFLTPAMFEAIHESDLMPYSELPQPIAEGTYE